MKLLISVRDVDEALAAAHGGADLIDLKEPGAGALGALPIAMVRTIVAALRRDGCLLPISATIGDLPMREANRIDARVAAVGACGVDYVKVGIERAPQAPSVLDRLARSASAVVPVFIADQGLEWRDVTHACTPGFAGVMLDTADKRAGSLFEAMTLADLHRFVDAARAGARMVGLAGALRATHAPMLRSLAPDFAGFRSAVCAGERSSALDPQRLHALVALMRGEVVAVPG